ncbi:NAD(P)H-hydrate dehydratase [Paludibacterium sp. B53371]|uniref:NAD(P)H-hydrate dehydratase n=1 Tax=Paludibacterium sp. B53371 TaxID=2806263 RepID=UPI001C05DCFD|nr:NAD(P)H-hydrate dehydratase [Paludibacterium sp. B53371]
MSSAIYSGAALRALEQRAETLGIDLMARAGQSAARWIAARWPTGAHILLAAGPGNNGGDALVCATALLHAGFRAEVLLPAAPRTAAARQALAAWQAVQGTTLAELPTDATRPDLLVDGLFGIGADRPFDPFWCALLDRLQALHVPTLALDVPTGLDAWQGTARNRVLRADATLTFLSHKPGLLTGDGPDLAGEIYLDTLQHPGWAGEAPEGAVYHPVDLSALLRPLNSHKGRFGTLAIAGGAEGMLGAALLAGRAALAAGAGKVLLATLDDRLAVDPTAPELMIRPADPLPDCDVLVIGPGLGQDLRARQLLQQALAHPGPLLLDADALNLLAGASELQNQLAERRWPSLITPHPAEAARLLETDTAAVQANRLHTVRTLAARLNAVTLLKGSGTLIAGPDGYYHVNTSGGPALAAAGQGDVLSGLIGALLAQKLDPFAAASLGAYVHGCVANHYTRQQGGPIGLSASATATALSAELNRLLPRQRTLPGTHAQP